MDRRNFIQAGIAGAAAGFMLPATAMAGEGSKLKSPLAGSLYYTKENPGRWAAKVAGHAPVVEAADGMIMVTTPHEMLAHEHYIVKHTLFDANMNLLGETMFDPTKDKAAISQYTIKEYKGVAYALSMCNKHDCWVTEFTV
ncbi:MAG: hypothetical protein MI808_23615 [Pseudomonadales bacterium]|nr:hypothetical protein [Pseudomonadales bacterium]